MARLLLAALAGAALGLATLAAVLWIMSVQATITAGAIEAHRARVAAESIAAAIARAPRPAPNLQPMGDL